ncbi:MAG: protein-tyrosine kinase [Lachnospiraceae bacterium]|nr:protein-tyrosine kinase [Lachnospiraceae bacterium]
MEEEFSVTKQRAANIDEIDLGELLFELWLNKLEIILAMAFGAVAAFFLSTVIMTPKYTSQTSLYVLAKQEANTNANTITTADLSVGTQLTNDYQVLMTSRPVLEQTIAELGLDMTTEELADMVKVTNDSNTRILKIEVTNEDPQLARNIADTLRTAVSEQIISVMNIDAVNTVEDASMPLKPSSPNKKRNILIGLMAGFVLSAGLIVLRSIMDDTVKNSDDVERYLGVPVMGMIPDSESVDIAKEKR